MPKEGHYVTRTGWLRAAVLGANDGIVSTSSLLAGVLAAGMERPVVLLTGLAALVAGAFSMASGEYVSVAAQSDSESADLELERRALEEDPDYELDELTSGLVERGVSPPLARAAAREMTAHDALDAHAREELGLTETGAAAPMQAALASAAAFATGAALPLAGAALGPAGPAGVLPVAALSLAALGGLGLTGARLGGAPAGRAAARALLWGGAAMGATALVGRLFDVAV
ncbi:VIT family protein [Rhodosalinus sediminis]|uniref:VIT family protein n=1 Tax=Rhodosalinus sediminis TaxID=1940533 RepID=A0A3D9BSL1_9RHOB|nr:VIT1/CCC1 transporter family protein [Rhodosalinus sediminis]REC56509.1 VIT family protein [Rhodosalinus sediminis]